MLTELQSYLENRLRVIMPTIDLDPGSPAQTQFIQPVLAYLGTDPIETDITTFLQDRMSQQFPNLCGDNPSVLTDLFVKPLITFLEPFKREILSIKRNQSLKDPSLLSDDDADALVANVFDSRPAGGYASGIARIFFNNPSSQQVELSSRFFTPDGLNFYPTTPSAISAEEMVFNRSGNFFFMDVNAQAEAVGDNYNIDAGTLSGVVGFNGAVKVSNPWDFTNGLPTLDTPTFCAQAEESLTERSLVTRRGGTAIVNQVFKGSVAGLQVIGATDPEMQRDILGAVGPGHTYLIGKVGFYGSIALILASMVDDEWSSSVPTVQAGDTIFAYLDAADFPSGSLTGSSRLVRVNVEKVLFGPLTNSTPGIVLSYVVQWSTLDSHPLPDKTNLSNKLLQGGVSSVGTVKISSIPDIGSVTDEVPSQSAHLFGHSDYYVRPDLPVINKTVISSLANDPQIGDFKLQAETLSTVAASNVVTDLNWDYVGAGVEVGDFLTILTGADAGTYTVEDAEDGQLTINASLTTTADGIRYQVTKNIIVNPFDPRIPKLPFGATPCNDLELNIGSNVFTFIGSATDLPGYKVTVGDTIRVLSSANAGDYTIVSIIDGKHVTVDRAVGISSFPLPYEIFTKLSPVNLPLVRIKELMLLDSSQQTTGIAIPPAEPVAIVPRADLTSAQVKGLSQQDSGFVLPDLSHLMNPLPNPTNGHRNSSPQGRYSTGLDLPTNTYGAMSYADSLTADEFDYRTDMFGRCSYFVAPCEDTSKTENFPPIDPKPGDALTLKSGPNAGSYLIKDVDKVRYKTSDGRSVWVYLIRIYGEFPVDILGSIVSFLDYTHATYGPYPTIAKFNYLTTTLAVPGDLAALYYLIVHTLFYSLNDQGLPVLMSDVSSVVNSMFYTNYEWGDPARGTLRTFLYSPTVFQQNTADNEDPTIFSYTTASGAVLKFRTDPDQYTKQELVPPRLDSDAAQIDYPRDLDASVALTATFDPTIRPTMFNLGIEVGDVLSVLEEVFLHGGTGVTGTDIMSSVATTMNSTVATFVNESASAPFTSDMVGNILSIQEGDDKGEYTIVNVLSSTQVTLDRPLSSSTPHVISGGRIQRWGSSGGAFLIDNLNAPTVPFTVGMLNKYITLYGIDSSFQGSFRISDVSGVPGEIGVDRSSFTRPWPDLMTTPYDVGFWVVTDPLPDGDPTQTFHGSQSSGTELIATRPIRIYDEVPTDYPISAITQSSTVSQVTLGSSVKAGTGQPFRIYRNNVRRVTPTEMSKNIDGPLCYFDTEVVSMGPESSFNILQNSYLTVDDGTYMSVGYVHRVDDFTLSYSTQETGTLVLPTRVLPVNSPDSEENFLSLLGAPIRVTYEYGDVVNRLQSFLSSAQDRVTTANLLARHMLPSYFSYDATYSGGSAPSVIAQDIINYVSNLSVETPVDVSELENLIDQRGGNPVTPTTAIILIYDWDRKMWAEFSENQLGGTTTQVPYHGTPRVTFLSPGPDESGQSPMPSGERINLTQL